MRSMVACLRACNITCVNASLCIQRSDLNCVCIHSANYQPEFDQRMYSKRPNLVETYSSACTMHRDQILCRFLYLYIGNIICYINFIIGHSSFFCFFLLCYQIDLSPTFGWFYVGISRPFSRNLFGPFVL